MLGVDYYPEQWDASRLSDDLDTIVELGADTIRIAEFAWHLMEKTEGNFDFSFFDRVIAAAKERGLAVVMGTPTATIPAWLAHKYPSILSEFENGKKRAFGGRHVACYHSSVLYEYSEKILRALARHYRNERAIVAWQIDNELGHEGSDLCYCDKCRTAFQAFLARKFDGNIERLNGTWGTTFWSQEYNNFSEIPVPSETITTHNPALRLDWERFRSKSITDFSDFQLRILREILPDAVLFHDFPGGGLYKHVDYARLAEPLDVVAYNNYPVWGGQREPLPPNEIAFGLDYIRGLKRENFWITEAIMGAQGHDVMGYAPRPGEAKLWSWQAFAHGGTSLFYFRFRGAVKGAEQFCYGILDADNVRGRKFREVQDFFRDVRKYEKAWETPITAPVAIIYDYDSLASFRIQRQSFTLDVPAEMVRLHKIFFERNVPVDVIPASADLSPYRVVLTPQMILRKKDFADRLQRFARAGGTVVLTYRTAVKDENNNLVFGEPLPLYWHELAGIRVAETESLQEGQNYPLVGIGAMEGERATGGIFREFLEVRDAEILCRYDDAWYKNYAAVTRKPLGNGWLYYVGCGAEDNMISLIFQDIIKNNNIIIEESDDGVEICYRGGFRIVLNHNEKPAKDGDRTLAPYECRIEPARARTETRPVADALS